MVVLIRRFVSIPEHNVTVVAEYRRIIVSQVIADQTPPPRLNLRDFGRYSRNMGR